MAEATQQTETDIQFLARFLLTPEGHRTPAMFERLERLAKGETGG